MKSCRTAFIKHFRDQLTKFLPNNRHPQHEFNFETASEALRSASIQRDYIEATITFEWNYDTDYYRCSGLRNYCSPCMLCIHTYIVTLCRMAAVADETRIEEGRRTPKRSGVLGMVNKYLQHTTKLRRMRYSSNERDSK